MTQSDSRVAVYTGSFDPITLGHLNVIEETPDPYYGALGVSSRILRCDSPACGRLLTEA